MKVRLVMVENPKPFPNHFGLVFTYQGQTEFYHRGAGILLSADSIHRHEHPEAFEGLVMEGRALPWAFQTNPRQPVRYTSIPVKFDASASLAWCKAGHGRVAPFSLLRGNNCIDYVTQALRAGGATGLPDRPGRASALFRSWFNRA